MPGLQVQVPCEVVFDIYTTKKRAFQTPQVDGLDVAALRPVEKIEAPERFGRNVSPALGIPDPAPEALEVLLKATYVYRVRFTSREPGSLNYLAHAIKTAESLAKAVHGVVRDVHTGLIFTADGLRRVLKSNEYRISDHVLTHAVAEPDGRGLWVHTHGLVKFGRPDLEARSVPVAFEALTGLGLLAVGDYLSRGNVLSVHETVELGTGVICVSGTRMTAVESFPAGLLTLDDFDPMTRTPLVGLTRWIASATR